LDGKNVIQSQSYGPEARGGASRAEIIIADGPIFFPKATWLDIMLAMSQKASDEYVFDLKNGGTLIVDSTYVSQIPTSNALVIPISARTRQHFGREIFSNIVALGVLCEATGIVSPKALLAAIGRRVPRETEKINIEAFNFGRKLAEKFHQKQGESKHDTVAADS